MRETGPLGLDGELDAPPEAGWRQCRNLRDLPPLITACNRTANGKIAVRWNGATREKEIRTYQDGQPDPGLGGTVLALIPRSFWRKP